MYARSPTRLTLYTADRCPYAARVRIVLVEKGLAYERVEIDLRDRPAFMFDKNPSGTVPVLEQDDGFVLPESRAIMEYLEECFPEPTLLAGDVKERARVRLALDQFERFAAAYYAWRFRGESAAKLQDELEKLDRRLEADEYLVGSQFSLADIGYLPWILRAEHQGAPVRRLAGIAGWLVRVSARPSVAAEIETVESLPRSHADTVDLSFWGVSAEAEAAARRT